MKKITMEYYGFTGSGSNLKEAKADAARQLAEAMEGDYNPRLISWRGVLALVARDPKTGWGYRILHPDLMRFPMEPQYMNTFGGDCSLERTLRDACLHVASNTRKTGEYSSELLDMIPREYRQEAIREFESRSKGDDLFQARHKEAREAGLPDGVCHQYACSHGWIATLDDFRRMYPEAIPA